MAEGNMANIDELPGAPSIVKIQQYQRKTMHFFYERPDGTIIDVSEQEAAVGLKMSQKFRMFKQVGVSDGSAAIAYMKANGYLPGKQMAYEKAQEIVRAAREAEIESARGHFRNPRLAEWAYPDNSVPQSERQDVQLPTNE